MQTKLMNFYFISLSVGIGLYMYEHIQDSFTTVQGRCLFGFPSVGWFELVCFSSPNYPEEQTET